MLVRVLVGVLVCALGAPTPASAFQVPQEGSRFDALTIADPSRSVPPASLSLEALPASEPLRAGWQSFRSAHGDAWEIHLDRRSGAPLLVAGRGIPWVAGSGNALAQSAPPTLDGLASSLRAFVSENRSLLLTRDEELDLDRSASGLLSDDTWQVVFDRVVDGIPVPGDRYLFTVGHGNLIAFGATRWSPIRASALPSVDSEKALNRLRSYMGITDADIVETVDQGSLLFVPVAAPGTAGLPYAGPIGGGYQSALAWRFVLRVAGDDGTWVGLVDAQGGGILALYDDNQYARVKGGVYPLSDDQICPDGCEQGGYPMPFANISIGGAPQSANAMGMFNCTPAGGIATTTLAGTYVRVNDLCGPTSQSVSCDDDLDAMTGSGTDCSVPPGSSAGNTHAARSSFYHLNRIMEKARAWLPSNTWLTQQLTDNVNINTTCNAFWSGSSVNFYRSGSSCRNSGEIAGVFLHEWGHGLDQNDGGGMDNPSEAYADITSFLQTHASCIGRGFLKSGFCSGYGNACLSCTGVRDVDWNQRANHAPSTPAGFLATNCTAGGGPCGKEVHCEAYVATETLYDLATRDLPAGGFDSNTAWQITDRLWYKSRLGSGGNAYTCSGTVADGCAAGSWFTKLRAVDDDDGNLANGTPHAAAIFAAFNRHGISCGAAGDASNRSTSSCPSLATPSLTAVPSLQTVGLSWTAVPGAAWYRILRNDASCSAGYTVIATVAGTSYMDTGLANGFPEHYAVQAIGSNSACESGVSACQTVTPNGPHGRYSGHTLLQDTCTGTGGGGGNGVWDSGERVQIRIMLKNDGNATLTALSATLSSTSPGVNILTGTAAYANLPPGASAASTAPDFLVQLPTGLACGSILLFQLGVSSAQGSWTSSFVQTIGQPSPGGTVALNENFSAGIPTTWTIVDGGSGGGSAATWTTSNPGNRSLAVPLATPAATVDSDWAGASASQDEQLITPVMNLSTVSSVTLDLDQYFRWYNLGLDEKGDVDVRSSRTGGTWSNVLRNQQATGPNPDHRSIDITSQAAGASDVQIRFHYYNASNEWFWQVDNVKVSDPTPSGCNMMSCAPAGVPPPVPDGSFGSAMRATRANAAGAAIDLVWDVARCPAPGYHVLYGPLGGVSVYSLSGAACTIGSSGSYHWTGVPSGSLWFVIVADNGSTLEGSWGKNSSGADLAGSASSGRCGMVTRNNGGICGP